MFLAGGVAFNILLAGVPFILLLSSGMGYLLGTTMDSATALVQGVVSGLMPQLSVQGTMLDPVLEDVVRTRAAVGIGGAIGFLYFSARLFGALRSVMSYVFDHGRDRTALRGLLWDVHLTLMTLLLIIAWVVVSAFITVSNGRIGAALVARGINVEIMTGVELFVSRVIALAVVVAIFVSLYRWLPKKKTEWQAALGGAITAGLLFELARWLFGIVVSAFPPTTIYTGTLGALVVIVFWTYYAALIFVLGAEVASAIHAAQPPPAEST
jgi:membrane protein